MTKEGLVRVQGGVVITVAAAFVALTASMTGTAAAARTPEKAGAVDAYNVDLAQNQSVHALGFQSDNKILLGGSLGIVGSVDGIYRAGLVRTDSNGAVDESFYAPLGSLPQISAILVERDDAIIVAGSFSTEIGVARSNVARLQPDGSIDVDFVAETNGTVTCIALEADGDLLIGGSFTEVNGEAWRHVARLRPDGSLDPSFAPTVNGPVFTIAVQPDGRIIIGGDFDRVGAQERFRLARLNPNGLLDKAFDPRFISRQSVWSPGIFDVEIQTNGKLLVGGAFLGEGQAPNLIARLNSDGSIDTTFADPRIAPVFPSFLSQRQVNTITLQANGKILIGGNFSTVGGKTRQSIARLNPDGSLDASFLSSTNPDSRVLDIAIQADRKVMFSGWFRSVNGVGRQSVARVNSTPDTPPLSNTAKPTVVGIARVGQLLKASPGSWSPKPAKITFVWRAGAGGRVVGRGPSLSVPNIWPQQVIDLTVIASRPGYASSSVTVSVPFRN